MSFSWMTKQVSAAEAASTWWRRSLFQAASSSARATSTNIRTTTKISGSSAAFVVARPRQFSSFFLVSAPERRANISLFRSFSSTTSFHRDDDGEVVEVITTSPYRAVSREEVFDEETKRKRLSDVCNMHVLF